MLPPGTHPWTGGILPWIGGIFRGEYSIDTVIGKKDEGEPCVLTLVERMTRMCIWVKARNHTAEAINEALQKVMSYFAEQKDQVFKTITQATV